MVIGTVDLQGQILAGCGGDISQVARTVADNNEDRVGRLEQRVPHLFGKRDCRCPMTEISAECYNDCKDQSSREEIDLRGEPGSNLLPYDSAARGGGRCSFR